MSHFSYDITSILQQVKQLPVSFLPSPGRLCPYRARGLPCAVHGHSPSVVLKYSIQPDVNVVMNFMVNNAFVPCFESIFLIAS